MATFTLSATCVAIAQALETGTLTVREEFSQRLQECYWSISDQHGTIEVALTRQEADERIAEIKGRLRAA